MFSFNDIGTEGKLFYKCRLTQNWGGLSLMSSFLNGSQDGQAESSLFSTFCERHADRTLFRKDYTILLYFALQKKEDKLCYTQNWGRLSLMSSLLNGSHKRQAKSTWHTEASPNFQFLPTSHLMFSCNDNMTR